jgi:hypothetical protein
MPEEVLMPNIVKTFAKILVVLVAVAAFFSAGALYSHNMQQVVFKSERLVANIDVMESAPALEGESSGDLDGVRQPVLE